MPHRINNLFTLLLDGSPLKRLRSMYTSSQLMKLEEDFVGRSVHLYNEYLRFYCHTYVILLVVYQSRYFIPSPECYCWSL